MKEERFDEIINSVAGIERAKAPLDGLNKLQHTLAQRREAEGKNKYWIAIAAAIAFAICSNAYVVTDLLTAEDQVDENTSSYSLTSNFNLY